MLFYYRVTKPKFMFQTYINNGLQAKKTAQRALQQLVFVFIIVNSSERTLFSNKTLKYKYFLFQRPKTNF